MAKFNHRRPLKSFSKEIEKIKKAGFNLIGVSQMYFEDVFIFETRDEAEKAYHTFENDMFGNYIGKIVGYWHSREDFKEAVRFYEIENNGNSKVKVHWL